MTNCNERRRRRDQAAEWSWYSVERANSVYSANPGSLTRDIGRKLRTLYAVPPVADEPPEIRLLLDALEAQAGRGSR